MSSELKARHDEFDTWVREVRQPAARANEGVRRIETRTRDAIAEYEIAPLPDGRWALCTHMEYRTGDGRGIAWPWQEFGSRDECVAEFLSRAKRHFGCEIPTKPDEPTSDGYGAQRDARKEMLSLLSGEGLFGFIEPEPAPTVSAEKP